MTRKQGDFKIHYVYSLSTFVTTACGRVKKYNAKIMNTDKELTTCKTCLKALEANKP
jgi:hypothetical protein